MGGCRRLPHLLRRGGTFYFRMAVPGHWSEVLARREIKISLRTLDRQVARLRCRALSNRAEQIFAELATMYDPVEVRVATLVQQYFADRMDRAKEITLLAPMDPYLDRELEISLIDEDLEEHRQRLATGDYTKGQRATAIRLLKQHSVQVHPAEDAFNDLCQGLVRAQAESLRIYKAMLEGRYEETAPKDPLFKDARLPRLPSLEQEDGGAQPSLAASIAKYCEYKNAAWVTKTLNENRRVLSWFSQLVDPNKPMSAVDLEDVRQFRDGLMKVPANHSKLKHLQGLAFSEILKSSTSSQQRLHPKTMRKYWENLRAFLKWCVKEGYLKTMPGPGLELPTSSKVESARQPFSDEQLGAIFSSPQYAGHRSNKQRSSLGQLIIKDGKFWVPLIALYSGMRLGEILQLRACDVKGDQTVPYFDVNDRDGQQLKTSSSRRAIPIHPVLVQLGLLAYIDERRSKDKNGRLFPEIEPGKDGYPSHNFSKYFGRYMLQIGAKTDVTAFHSFRHCFTDALRAADVPDYNVKRLLGHADTSVTAGYGSKPNASALYADLCKVTYPAVEAAMVKHLQPIP